MLGVTVGGGMITFSSASHNGEIFLDEGSVDAARRGEEPENETDAGCGSHEH